MPYFDTKDKNPAGFSEEECRLFNVCGTMTARYNSPTAGRKILFVVQHVDSSDIKAGKLLYSSPGRETFEAILDLANGYVKKRVGKIDYEWAAINFNYFRTYHLKGVEADKANKLAVARTRKLIKALKPDAIVILGDSAAEQLISIPHVKYLRGWVHQVDYDGTVIPTTNTIDFDRTYVVKLDEDEDDDNVVESSTDDQYETAVANANLVDYIAYNIASAIAGKMLYSGEVRIKPVVVDTIKKFDKLVAQLMVCKTFAYDTETDGLSIYDTKILIHQFSFDSTKAFIVPYYHYQTPFSAKELKYIRGRLREVFARTDLDKDCYIVGQNLGFDYRMARQEFGLTVIYWRTWCVTAGDFLLQENIKMLINYGTKPYELSHIAARYGIDFYYTAEFSKADRTTIKDTPLTKELYEYCAADTIIPWVIHDLQLERAANLIFNGSSYTKMYKAMNLGTQSCLVRMMSVMSHRGLQLDVKEFNRLLSDTGPISTRMHEARQELYALPSVKKTNALLLSNKNIPQSGLFGRTSSWVFNVQTVDHKKQLFFEVMGLKPIRVGKAGPSMDKFFQKAYEKDHPEVKLLSEIQRLNTINNTYIIGWYKRLSEDPDGAIDYRLRPGYGYTPVVTGRSNSTRPNLQNVPQHSAEAKYIKRLMVAPLGFLKLDADYSAHEVRGWGLISRDPAVAAAFQQCLELIYEFRRRPTVENLIRMLLEADIHKVNYSLFTGTPVAQVTGEQRQSSKGIVFGSIYGMSLNSLAKQIKKALDETTAISKKFFSKFKKAKNWLDWAVQHAAKLRYVFSPLGRRRNLQGSVVPVQALQAAFGRRAMNSPIQGMGSDFGFIAAQLYTEALDKFCKDCGVLSNKAYFKEQGWPTNAFIENAAYAPTGVDSMVHDSLKSQTRYDQVFCALHIKEWAMITGVREYVKDWYDFDFNVDLAIEFELGASADAMEKWLWNNKTIEYTIEEKGETKTKVAHSMRDLVMQALVRQRDEFGYDIDVDEVLASATATYKQNSAYLKKNFPLAFEDYK